MLSAYDTILLFMVLINFCLALQFKRIELHCMSTLYFWFMLHVWREQPQCQVQVSVQHVTCGGSLTSVSHSCYNVKLHWKISTCMMTQSGMRMRWLASSFTTGRWENINQSKFRLNAVPTICFLFSCMYVWSQGDQLLLLILFYLKSKSINS